MEKIQIHTEFIKLQQFLKLTGVIGQGSDVKQLLQQKQIKVNGEIAFQRGKKLYSGDVVEVIGAGSYQVTGSLE